MKTNATVDSLRQQKEHCLHIIEIDKALTRLEANKDYKDLYNFLFNDLLLRHVQFAYGVNYGEEYSKRSLKLAKAISRTKDYLDSFHQYAEDCSNRLTDIDVEIVRNETEE